MLKKLYLKNYRNHAELKLNFERGITILSGANGRGKTNILESIYFLSLLRSFKSAKIKDLVKIGEDSFTLMAEIISEQNERNVLKVTQLSNNKKKNLAINGQEISRSSDFIKSFRTVIFSPEDRLIISSTASYRRKFFDILISLEEKSYLNALQSYNVALMQRNAILKKRFDKVKTNKLLNPFEVIMAENAIVIMKYREQYSQIISEKIAKLWGDENQFNLQYQPKNNLQTKEDMLELFSLNLEKDLLKGYTSIGIQLDDFDFMLNDKLLRTFGSSGQIRLSSIFLRMAEFELSQQQDNQAVALVDDVTGELDDINSEKFFSMLKGANQAIFTFAKEVDKHIFGEAKIYNI